MGSSDSSKKPSTNNSKWVNPLLLILLALVAFMLFQDHSPHPVKLDDVKKLLKDGHVEKLSLREDTNTLYVTLNKEGIEAYKKKLEEEKKDDAPLPSSGHHHLQVRVPRDFLKTIYHGDWKKELGDKFLTIDVEVKTWFDHLKEFAFSSPFGSLFLLLTLVWFFFPSLLGFDRKKSLATLWDKRNKTGITFKDIQGMAEAKEQLKDMVNYFKHPKRYKSLGAIPPKGALLVGPPGTGKTLLARALAGESKVAFLSVSGSDFEEVYVGLGAQRIRQLFKDARKNAPCIIFIDEIDALGYKRNEGGVNSGHDSSTLNQFLSEMDGFTPSSGVLVIASTNRPKVLDDALVRSGRLGRIVYTSYPTVKERKATFDYYKRKIKSHVEVSSEELASKTAGFSYADIKETCNSAALIAVNKNHSSVCMSDFYEAVDQQIGGVVRKESILKPKEKKIVAFHEAGHALVGHSLPNTEALVSVTIMPRTNAALGFAQFENEEKHIHQLSWFEDELSALLGGKAAEEIIFGETSTGAQNDLERVTKMAYSMVSVFGMSKKIGNFSYYDSDNPNAIFSKPYATKVGQQIDDEAKKFVEAAYKKALAILTLHEETLRKVAEALIEKEELRAEEFVNIVGASKEEFITRTTAGLIPKKRGRKKKEDVLEEETKEE